MAPEAASVWKARLCVSRLEGGRVCGRLFLARMPEARHPAQDQRRVLEREDPEEQGARPFGERHAPEVRLEGGACLGTRAPAKKCGPAGGPAAQAFHSFPRVSGRGQSSDDTPSTDHGLRPPVAFAACGSLNLTLRLVAPSSDDLALSLDEQRVPKKICRSR